MTTDYTPVPQTFTIEDSPHYMERPIEVTVTTHLNAVHNTATKVFLTRGEAKALVRALIDYLIEENDS